mgnify:CR=1 FL=1
MGFRLAKTRQFHRRVTVHDQSFGATFNALSDEELQQFQTNTKEGQCALLRAAVHDLDEIEDEDGKPLPYTEALLEKSLGYSDVRNALLREYSLGIAGARAGN